MEQAPDHGFRTQRMEAFSDGVFAIAITLLVLDIGVPAGSADDLLGAVLDQWPSYLAFVISFSTVGALWLGHNAMTEFLDHADARLLRYNLLLLLLVSFLPFPTRLLSEYILERDAERVAVTVYGATLLAAVGLLAQGWRHALRAGLVRADVDAGSLDELTRRLTPGQAGYLVAITVGLFAPIAAVVIYGVLAMFLVLPSRRRTSG